MRHTPRDRLPPVQLYKGRVGETFENVLGRDFAADGPWQKMGTDVTEFKLSFGRAYLAPVYDFGSKEIVAHSISLHPDLAQQEEMLGMLTEAKPEGSARSCTRTWAGSTSTRPTWGDSRRTASHQSMSRKGNCLDNGATEQVFGHLKDEFFRGRDWGTFEEFKADLEAYIRHWNHVRRQVAEGPDPGGIPGAGPSGPRGGYDLARPSFGAQFMSGAFSCSGAVPRADAR